MSDALSRRAWLGRATGLAVSAAAAASAAGVALLAVTRPADAASRPAADGPAPGPLVTVYKDPNCGCCEQWVAHVAAAGFRPAVNDVADMPGVKRRLGVPEALASCHTSVVEGYVLEGHVPAADVRRLLATRPRDVKGLAVPGMPHGSPGMETGRVDRYDVLALLAGGGTRRWATHGAAGR